MHLRPGMRREALRVTNYMVDAETGEYLVEYNWR